MKAIKNAEFLIQQQFAELESKKAQEIARIEMEKFKNMMSALGQETLVRIAGAGQEQQAKILQSLGLKGYLITDGKSPINLLSTASGLIGAEPMLINQSQKSSPQNVQDLAIDEHGTSSF